MSSRQLRSALARRLGLSAAALDKAALTMLLRHVDRIDSLDAATKPGKRIRLRFWHSGDDRALASLLERLGGPKADEDE